ncbi:MAG: sodium/solute symporter [Planctomycetales bacterium]|nr:sodium/solute symporter [Planctomycetales bacterium]
MSAFTPIDWAICLGYLAIVFALALWFARGQNSNEDFFVGGRRMHWLPIGLSLFAGTISSLSFVGLPSTAAYSDYHLYLAILCIPVVVTPIVWKFFLPLYFRMGVTSSYEYVEKRFSRRLRLVCSVLFMFYTIGWMGNMLRAVGVILEAVFDLSPMETAGLLIAIGLFATLYTTIGGVKAVVWTDAIQAVAVGGSILLVLFLAVSKVDGGWSTVWQVGNEHGRFAMFNTSLSFSEKRGDLWGAMAFGMFVYLATHTVNFGAVQRYVSMPSQAAAGWALVVNGLMVAIVCGVFFVAGSTIFAFYQQQAARPEAAQTATASIAQTEAAAGTPIAVDTLYDQLKRDDQQDQLLPRFVMTEIPIPGLIGLLLAGLFAAAMSSIDSGINSMTASVVCDWQSNRHLELWYSRLLCASFGLLSVGVAIMLYFNGGNVFPMIMKIAGMFFGLQLGLFLLGMTVKRASAASATIGMVAGFVGLASTFVLDISHWWYGAVTCVPTFVVGLVASFLCSPDAKSETVSAP